jgi:XRE family transcriptional regulator, regulator of sulfur utilization
MDYAKALRTIRATKGITQKGLAKLLDIDQGYISRIEGNEKKPSLEMLENIAKKLEVPLHALLLLSYEKEDLKNSSDIEVKLMGKQILDVITNM